jgi:hypothetical protein
MADSDRNKNEKTEVKRDAGITRMLNTPPKPHKDMKKGKPAKERKKSTGETDL